jgi:phosphate transport system permease protein
LDPLGPVPREIRLSLSDRHELGPRSRRFWRVALHLRNLAVLAAGVDDFHAGGGWPAGASSARKIAAIPSVILGLLSIFTLIPLMRQYVDPFLKHTLGFTGLFTGPASGYGYLTAAVILAIMTLPYIISISREALLEVPRDQREAALALGATRWESTIQIVVPYARLGIFGSIFLGLARALGETMAVTMVIGNDPAIHASLLAPGYTIASVIANEFSEAGGDLHLSSLVEIGLVLFFLTIVINALARLLILATTKKGTGRIT